MADTIHDRCLVYCSMRKRSDMTLVSRTELATKDVRIRELEEALRRIIKRSRESFEIAEKPFFNDPNPTEAEKAE